MSKKNIRIIITVIIICIIITPIFAEEKSTPPIYLLDSFSEWSSLGAASPYFFFTSPTLRYNPSVSAFLTENDFTFAYRPVSFAADNIIGGFSFTRKLVNNLTLGGIFSMFTTVNILNIGEKSEDDYFSGYQNYLIIPSLSYKFRKNIAFGGEMELHYQ